MNISLNIFTNAIATAPDTSIIMETYQSFCDTFGEIPATVYCDSHPNIDKFQEYFDTLSEIFPVVIETESLSDGYVRSIYDSDADYLFQLEGDWAFNRNIKHSLEEILQIMQERHIYHFRFNKRSNLPRVWDRYVRQVSYNGFKYCETPNLSNNPHIIDRVQYLNIANRIQILPGSKGIEEILLKYDDLHGTIYGPLGYPATVRHLDGRGH